MAKLIVKNISKHYNSIKVLDDVSFTADDGDTIAILGPSGSGKSTLLNIIGSLDTPDSGEILCNDTEVTRLSGTALSEFRANQIGFIFQDHHLLPQLTVLENVLIPTIPADKMAGAAERANALLDRMGIGQKADSYPSKLSGGERQRAAVARALINSPGLLLCDEPTGSLDIETGSTIMTLLIELAAEQNVTVIVVTHNLDQAKRLSRSMSLHNGSLDG